MSTTVDNRVVEMRFDNKEFESGVSTSISSLEKLKKSLNLKGAADSFDDLDKATRKLDFVGLGDAVEAINNKFSILGTIGDQILRRIGDAIYDVQAKAISLVKSLTIDQVSAGWEKFADKTTAVHTIMAATAKDIGVIDEVTKEVIYKDQADQMKKVNEQLDRLNWFTDETSYNFVDMVSNIGKFTSNGRKLDESVTAMQGIAVWAGISGANQAEASRAMYNMSQALGAGSVQLRDWMSIENANMATVEFKETVMETAYELGKLKKNADGTYKTLSGTEVDVATFRQSLSNKAGAWFDSEVLTKTLEKYGGFTNELNALYNEINKDEEIVTTSEILRYIDDYKKGVRDFSEASKITGIDASNLISRLERLGSAEMDLGYRAFKASQEAKTFEEAINATKDAVSTGWMTSFELIFGNYTEAKKLWTTVANEMWDVFAGGGSARNRMLKEWHEGGGYDLLWEAVSNLWEGLKGIGEKIGNVWKSIFPGIDSDKLLSITEAFHSFSESFRNSFVEIEETVDAIVEPVSEVATVAIGKYQKTMEVLDSLVNQVWAGKWGVGDDRRRRLEEAGYYYELVQNAVNASVGDSFRYAIKQDEVATSVAAVTEELISEKEALEESIIATEEQSEELTVAQREFNAIQNIISGVASALSIIIRTGRAIWRQVLKPVLSWANKNVLLPILEYLGQIGLKITDTVQRWKETNLIETKLQGFVERFTTAKDRILEFFTRLRQLPSVIKFLEYFGKFKDFLSGIAGGTLDRITNFFGKGGMFSSMLPSMDQVLEMIDKIVSKFNDFFGFIEDGWPSVQEFFTNLTLSPDGEAATSIAAAASNIISKIFSNNKVRDSVSTFFGNLWGGITGAFTSDKTTEGATSFFENFSNAITGMWNTVNGSNSDFVFFEFLGNVLETVLKTGKDVLAMGLGFSIVEFIHNLAGAFKGWGKIPGKIPALITQITNAFRSLSFTITAFGILAIAAAFAVLSVSLRKLAAMPAQDLENLTRVVGTLIPFFGVLIGLAYVIGKFWGSANQTASAIDEPLVNVGKITLKLPKMALMFKALAALLLSVVAAVAIFGFMPYAKLQQGLEYLSYVAAGLGIMIVAFGLVAHYTSVSDINTLSKVFLRLAVALDLMIPIIAVLAYLAHWDGQALGGTIAAIFGLLVALGVGMVIASSARYAGLVKFGGQMILMAIALDLMIPVIAALTYVAHVANWKNLMAAAGAIAGIMLALSVAALIAGKAKAKGVAALGLLAGGLAAVGIAFASMKGVNWKDIKQIALAVGIFVTAIAVLGALISYYAPNSAGVLTALALAIAAVGASMLMAGVGALAFSKAIDIIANSSEDVKKAAKNLGDGIGEFFDSLMVHSDSIVAFVGRVVEAIVLAITLKKANITELGGKFLSWLITGLQSKKGLLIAALLLAVGAALEALDGEVDFYASEGVRLILKLVNDIAKALRNNIDGMILAFKNVWHTVFYALAVALQSVMKDSALQRLIDKFWFYFAPDNFEYFEAANYDPDAAFEAWLADQGPTNLEYLLEDYEQMFDEYEQEAARLDEQSKNANALLSSGAQNVSDGLEEVQEAFDPLKPEDALPERLYGMLGLTPAGDLGANDFLSGVDHLCGMMVDSSAALDEASSSYDGIGEDLDLSLTGILSAIQGFMGNSQLSEEAGTNIISALATGELSAADLPVDALGNIDTAMLEQLYADWSINSPSKVTQDAGGYIAEGLALGVTNWGWLAVNAVMKLANAAIATLSNIGYRAYVYGYWFDRGLANGINAYKYLVNNKVQDMANSALNTLAVTMDSHSPSKETEKYGRFFDQGFGLGIEKNSNIIDDAVESASSNALNGIKAVVTRIIDAINGDFDTSMTITPVLDLSNIQNGATRIGEMLSPGSIGYSTGIANLAARTLNRSSEQSTPEPTRKVELTNNFYVQKMDEGMVDYFVNRINTELGARV